MLAPTQRSRFSALMLSSAVAAVTCLGGSTLRAQDTAPAATAPAMTAMAATAPAATVPAATAEAPVATAPGASALAGTLKTLADDFLHYSIVGNEQLTKSSGEALLAATAEPRDILAAFEAAAEGRDVRLILTRDQRQANLKDISARLLDKIEEGYRASSRDPKRIEADIDRLDKGARAYSNARDHLIAAGEFAVPYYIDSLRKADRKTLQPYIIRVMVEIGRPLLAPLVEELQTSDAVQKIAIIDIIGQIGYPQALPYLKGVLADPKVMDDVRKAAEGAIARIDPKGMHAGVSAADSFLALGQAAYHKKAAVGPMHPLEATNPIWYYDRGLDNVVGVPVPTSIWGSVLALRSAETALKLDPSKGQAISLWLAADMHREIQLPAGAKDPTQPEGARDAGFYARAAGPVYLNPALAMGLADHDSPLLLRTIAALEATGGIAGLVSPIEGGTPLVKALGYPDRAVRFSAAFALAKANPAKEYPGSFRIVPILAEAVSQTGTPNAIVIDPDDQNRNRIKAALTAQGFTVFEAGNLPAALENARKASAFELVLVPAGAEYSRLLELARTDYRLSTSPVLVGTPKDRMATVQIDLAGMPGTKVVDASADEKALAEAVATLKTEGSVTPVDQTAAGNFSMAAIKILGTLALDKASIYKTSEALSALTDALKDKRPEVVIAAAAVLGEMNSGEAQKAVATVALADNPDPAARTALFNSLAESAKRTGNALDPTTIAQIIRVVTTEPDVGVRNAAATALGALNVSSNQAAPLILQQAK